MEIPAGVVGGREAKITRAMPVCENHFLSLLLIERKDQQIPKEQANLIESAEKSWFLLSVSPYFHNLPQLFFRQEWLVPIVLHGDTVSVNRPRTISGEVQ